MTDSSHSMNPRGARLGVSFTHKETKQMSTTSRPRIKSQAVIDKCQVEIVDLKGTYVRSAGTKSAAILDGTELCRVEEFAARHFRRSGFEATFLESAPFQLLFCVYFWSVIERSRYRGIEACCRTGSPLASRSVADTLGMNRPIQSDKRSSNTISRNIRRAA